MTRQSFPLEYPVEVGGQTITELSLRRPKGGDIRRVENGKGSTIDRSFKLMADLAEVDMAVIDELDPADFDKINAWLEPILDPQGRAASST
jgi:hypothetical protein